MAGTLTETLRLLIRGDSTGGVKALKDLEKAGSSLEKTSSSWGAKMNTAANYGALGVAALAGVLGASAREFKQVGDNIDTVTDLTNLSSEAASLLSAQWQRFGVDATAGGNAVKFFVKNLDAARQGSAAQLEAFERLGLSQQDLASMDDEELLSATRDALAATDDHAARAAVSLQLFGRGAASLADWLDVSAGDMAEMNQQLERAGLVFGDEEMQRWQEALDAQREMDIALTGLKVTIGRDVVPALTPFVNLLGAALRVLRPLSPVLVPLTGVLASFVAVVKIANAVQGAWGQTIGRVVARLTAAKLATAEATVATKGQTVATAANTRVLGGSLATLGLYAGAIAAISVEIYAIVDAYMQWKSAADQAAIAAENAAAADVAAREKIQAWQAAHPGQPLPASYQALQQAINQNPPDYEAPSGFWGWLKEAWLSQFSERGWTRGFGLFASGGTVPARPGGTLVLAGEAGEDEDFVPASRRRAYARSVLGGGATLRVIVTGNTFVGTSRDAERAISDMVMRTLGPDVSRLAKGMA